MLFQALSGRSFYMNTIYMLRHNPRRCAKINNPFPGWQGYSSTVLVTNPLSHHTQCSLLDIPDSFRHQLWAFWVVTIELKEEKILNVKFKIADHVPAEYCTEKVSWNAQTQLQIIMNKCQISQMCPIQLPTLSAGTAHLGHNTKICGMEVLTVQHSQNNNIYRYHRSSNLQSKCYVCSKPHAQSQIPIIRSQAGGRLGKIFATTEMPPDDLDLWGGPWMCHNFYKAPCTHEHCPD